MLILFTFTVLKYGAYFMQFVDYVNLSYNKDWLSVSQSAIIVGLLVGLLLES